MNKKNHSKVQSVMQAEQHQKKQSWLSKLLERREDCGKMKRGKNCNG